MGEYRKIYAVDFDGTLAKTKFPEIIAPIEEMFEVCQQIKENGDILILWTCRCGKDLEDAVAFCKEHGLEFDYINENVPENIEKWGNDSRKIFAHEYIDDKSWSPDREEEFEQYIRKLKRKILHLHMKAISKIAVNAAISYGIAMFFYFITIAVMKIGFGLP